ncbi:MAG TPA: glycosyltransferase family 2 protein [Flavihumibacter sp.]
MKKSSYKTGAPKTVALLVTTYNWPSALELVLETILRQTQMPDEILIADDGSFDATRQVISYYKENYHLPLKHIWQPDEGFRKSLILNKAIKQTSCEYIIQIDGDILIDRHFVADHLAAAENGYFVQGCRVLINPDLTSELIRSGLQPLGPWRRGIRNRINATRIPFLAPLFKGRPDNNRNIKACNLAFWRKDFITVNGYNNEFYGWGWEDVEFATRLIKAGRKKKRLKMAGIAYHLHHPHSSRSGLDQNETIYLESSKKRVFACANGYNQAS